MTSMLLCKQILSSYIWHNSSFSYVINMYQHGIQSLRYQVLIVFWTKNDGDNPKNEWFQISNSYRTDDCCSAGQDLSNYLFSLKIFFSSYARGIQSTLSHHIPIRFTLVLYSLLSSCLFHSPSESWNAFLISPCGFKIQLISYFLTSSMSHMLKGINYAAPHHAASC
jgi:hypothetical protein